MLQCVDCHGEQSRKGQDSSKLEYCRSKSPRPTEKIKLMKNCRGKKQRRKQQRRKRRSDQRLVDRRAEMLRRKAGSRQSPPSRSAFRCVRRALIEEPTCSCVHNGKKTASYREWKKRIARGGDTGERGETRGRETREEEGRVNEAGWGKNLSAEHG